MGWGDRKKTEHKYLCYFVCESTKSKREVLSDFSSLCFKVWHFGLCILESQVKSYTVIFKLLSNFLLQVFEWAQEKEFVPCSTWFWGIRLTCDFITFKQLLHLVLSPDNFWEDGWLWACTLGRATLLWGRYAFFGEELMLEMLRFFFGHWKKNQRNPKVSQKFLLKQDPDISGLVSPGWSGCCFYEL